MYQMTASEPKLASAMPIRQPAAAEERVWALWLVRAGCWVCRRSRDAFGVLPVMQRASATQTVPAVSELCNCLVPSAPVVWVVDTCSSRVQEKMSAAG